MYEDFLRATLPPWMYDATRFMRDSHESVIVACAVFIVAIVAWECYRLVRAMKIGDVKSDLWVYDRELGREVDGHWRREQFRRYGALHERRHRHRHHRHRHGGGRPSSGVFLGLSE